MGLLLSAIHSEFFKLKTVKSTWVLLAAIYVICVGISGVAAHFLNETTQLTSSDVLSTFTMLCIPLVIVLSTMVVTTEYRYNTHIHTYLATPHKGVIVLAKFLVASLLAVGVTLVTSLSSLGISYVLGHRSIDFASLTLWKELLFLSVSLVSMVAVTHGLGYVLRNTAGVATLMIFWNSGIEGMIGFIPKIGETVKEFLYMTNLSAIRQQTPVESLSGGLITSGMIVAIYSIVFLGVGYVVYSRRDL